ncbi:hypothetical protein SmJEL517_g04116 [Synchytrium microbalum]|uniref:NADP-dependent oxidoreductase domain-containing protein n=1 Tax=Synchytrium microbalum TaxID=1806994 RepID=A0A507C187_9FUNG|nr:uncharacterized protein SmJEL517_g04116 [Synchytrium microbalum]TPX32819.1 hypothetical protein SmJEL517_g04116 [Synchytrium microbalum]
MSIPKPFPRRQLGKDGPMVSAIGFGAMGLAPGHGAIPSEEDAIKLLNRAIDLGCTFWDTADIYGSGHNENTLSKVLATRRSKYEVFLCTKFALANNNGVFSLRGDAAYVRQACEASLKRLGVSSIDLYYQHRVDPKVPIEETVGAMKQLVAEGKVKYLGLSECSAATLRRAHKVHPITAIQVEYSPWELNIEENERLATARELGIAVVAYSPLGRGFLTGAIKKPEDMDAVRLTWPRFKGSNFIENLKIVDAFSEIAKVKGVTPAQLCLAWCLFQDPLVIPIPGTTKESRLVENLSAVSINFTKEDDAKIRDILKRLPPNGDRYTPELMSLVNV